MTAPEPTFYAPNGQFTLTECPEGPLRGVSVAVKDLYDVAGYVTGAGNPWLVEHAAPAERHAAAVASLLDAGATVMGKTATDELAMGMFGVNSHYGTPWNPAVLDRVPGGSSSGSVSAVAGGSATLGLGTDTGGSIRTPASFCGVYGLRPTHGRIDVSGVRPMAPGFDTVSLLARTLRIIAAAFSVLKQTAETRGQSGTTEAGDTQHPREIRSLTLCVDLLEQSTPRVAELTSQTAHRWAEALGVDVVEQRLVESCNLTDIFWPLMSRQLWQSNGAWAVNDNPVLGEGIRERIMTAAEISDSQVFAAEAQQKAFSRRLDGLLRNSIAVLPTAIDAAPLRNTPHEELMSYRDRNLLLVVPASLAGAPQLSIPGGSVDGAPVGVSLLGLPGDDELLLSVAQQLDGSDDE